MEEKKYLTKWKMLAYGCGDVGATFTYAFIGAFIMMFLTDAMGLNAGIIGTLILVSKILDGVSDVIAGNIIDRTHKKMGKAKYWVLVTSIPLAVSSAALFFIPVNATETLQYAYFLIVYTLMSDVFYTLNYIAYGALGILMTRNKNEQMKSGVIRYVMVMIASLITSSATIALVELFGDGLRGWRITAVLYAVVFLIMELILLLKVDEYDEDMTEEMENVEAKRNVGLIQSLGYLVKNPYFMIYLFVCILYNSILTMNNSVGVYYMKYILGDASLLGLFTLSMMSIIVGIMFAPMLEKKIGIYKMTVYGWAVSCTFDIGFIIGAYQNSISVMMIFNILRWVCGGPYAASNIAICSEVAKYSYLKHGTHIEASCNGCTSMGTKIGAGIGSALMGWMLSLSGYVANADIQPASANQMLQFMYAVFPCIIHVVITILFVFFKVEKANKSMEENHVS